MAAFEVGELVFHLTGDPKQLVASNAAALKSFDNLHTTVIRGAALVSAAWLAASTAMIGIFKKVINELDDLQATAQSIGVPLDQLTALKYAADLSNVSIEELTTSLNLMNRQLGQLESQGTNRAINAFKAMNITITTSTGQLKGTQDLLLELSDRFKTYSDGVNKSALALDIFGRSGAKMVPFLNQGSAAIKDTMEQARQLGIVFDQQTGAAANAFNDQLIKLTGHIEGLAAAFSIKIMPEAARLVDIFDKLFDQITVNDGEIKKLNTSLEYFATLIYIIVESVKIGIDAMANLSASMTALWSALNGNKTADFERSWKSMSAIFTQTYDTLKQMREVITEIVNPPAQAGDEWTKLAQRIHDITGGLETLPTIKLKFAPELPNEEAAQAAAAESVSYYKKALEDQLSDSSVSLATKIDSITTATKKHALSFYDLGQSMKKVNDENKQNIESLATDTATALTTIFANNKAAAIAAAIINTAVGITEAMKLPPPFDIAKAALVAATGIAQIATIRSTSKDGGGASSSFSSSAASDSSSSGGGGAAAPTAGVSNTLHVTGIGPADLFTGDSVKVLADQLLQFQRDGGKVVLEQMR